MKSQEHPNNETLEKTENTYRNYMQQQYEKGRTIAKGLRNAENQIDFE